jgi:hypothetical protein
MKPQITTTENALWNEKGIENPRIFLINTEIATRKWILSDSEEVEEDTNE